MLARLLWQWLSIRSGYLQDQKDRARSSCGPLTTHVFGRSQHETTKARKEFKINHGIIFRQRPGFRNVLMIHG